jgi:hypothetical protein
LIVFDAVAALVDAETCPEARLARLAPPLPNEVMIPDRNERWASAPRGCDLQFFVVTSALVIALGLGSFGGWSLYQYISQSDELSGRAAVSALVERIIAVESNGDPNAKNSRSSAMGSGQFLDETWLNLVRAYRPDLVRGRNARETLDLRREPKLATLKATASGIDLQQPVDGLGFEAGSLGHALGSTPCRRTQQEAGAFRGEIRRIALTIVVLPTPGPPVMTSTLAIRARRIAAIWLSARARPIRFSTHGRALSGSIQGHGSVPFASRVRRSAIVRSAR